VTEVDRDELEIDGRPEGRAFFRLPLESVKSVEDGKVHLAIEMDPLTSPEAALNQSRDRGYSSGASSDPSDEAQRRTGASGSTWGGQTQSAADSWQRASNQETTSRPAWSGSQLDAAPRTAPTWDQQDDERGGKAVLGRWLAPVAVGTASAGAYVWWRKRQQRRSRYQRMLRALTMAGGSIAPLLEAARDKKRARWLGPLAAALVAGPVLASRRGRAEESSEGQTALPLPELSWRDLLTNIEMPTKPEFESPPPWTMAAPIVAAGLVAAWLASRGRPAQRSGQRRLGEIMTRNVQVARPTSTLFEAASMMRQLDTGFLPVCDGRRLQGVLTDRDIVVRSVADSRDPQLASVSDAMSQELVYAYEDDSVERGAELMRQHQIRRLPIVDRQKNLVGVVSLGDLAVDTGRDRLSGATLEDISKPARPSR
jgi:CBS domain-containing protein